MKNAILLLGSTGSGKSPLGDALDLHGLHGRTCRHFDFGHHLRRAAQGANYGLKPDEHQVVKAVLKEARLLAPSEFAIACKILDHFCRAPADDDSLIVLNGMPRHEQQATGVGQVIKVCHVIVLRCDAQTVLHRLARDSGGDRAGRTDDGLSLVEKKLRIYAEQTEPLIGYYRTKGVSVSAIDVSVQTQARDVMREIQLPPDMMAHTQRSD